MYKRLEMRILITGGAGFVGSHCLEGIILNTDWEITILDSLTYAGNLNRLVDISDWETEKKRVNFIWHDLKAPISETTHKLIGQIDYVWHLAAESHVENSLKDAIPFAYNVIVTTNLLEYLKKYQLKLRRYIGFNTDECFGAAKEGIYFKEIDKFYPSNPYSASKGGQWCMEYAFAHSFKMPISMVHSMNIVGQRQHAEKYVPKTIRSILNNEKVILHGIGNTFSSRKWIHARNICDGLLFLTEKAEDEQSYNIVGEERNVLEIANWICKVIRGRELFSKEYEIIDVHSLRPGHDLRYCLNGEKMENMGWNPKISLEQSIRRTVEWTIKHPQWL